MYLYCEAVTIEGYFVSMLLRSTPAFLYTRYDFVDWGGKL